MNLSSTEVNLGPKRSTLNLNGPRRGDYRVEYHADRHGVASSHELAIFDGDRYVDRYELLDSHRRLQRIKRSAEVLAADLTDALR